VAGRARVPAAAGQLGQPGLGAVLDEREAVLVREGAQRADPGGRAEQVHRHDRAGARPDERGHGVRIEIAVGRVDVGEDRTGVMISSPGSGAAATTDRWRAAVPDAHAIAWREP
jgi:hypothetical protein